jgi:DNA invertase Pin-like site-specific DNA recombinase
LLTAQISTGDNAERMSAADGARRAVAYIRLADSRLDLVEGSTEAPRAQRHAIETWAQRERVAVTSWQMDIGVGGATPIAERPGLVAAYRAIAEQRAGVLVAANAERFSHDELVSWLIERAALTQGATLETADGSRPPIRRQVDAPEEKTAWTRGAVALARAHQQVTLRTRIRASLAEKRARGERVGTVPYGYRLATDGLHIEPDEAEQTVVATVRRLAREGLSQRAIVARLADCGVAGRTGAPLRQTQVAKILRSAS